MKKSIVIGNATEFFELRSIDQENLWIMFRGDGVSFETKSYLYEDADELAAFFGSLAEDWQGWTGVKSWSSVEGDFKIEASHNGYGEVRLKVSLVKNQGASNEYQFVGNMPVEPGSLSDIAFKIRAFLLETTDC